MALLLFGDNGWLPQAATPTYSWFDGLLLPSRDALLYEKSQLKVIGIKLFQPIKWYVELTTKNPSLKSKVHA